MKEPEILFDGACAYAVRTKEGFRIFVSLGTHSSPVGDAKTIEQAERVCRRLNAYPERTVAYVQSLPTYRVEAN